jgi:hypothetical protein
MYDFLGAMDFEILPGYPIAFGHLTPTETLEAYQDLVKFVRAYPTSGFTKLLYYLREAATGWSHIDDYGEDGGS